MTPLQLFANLVLAALAVAVNHWLWGYVAGEPAVVPFLVDVLLVVAVFASNLAAQLRVK